MPKLYKISIVIVLIITGIGLYYTTPTTITEPTKEYSFKKTNWGMSKTQVITSETATLVNIIQLYDNDDCLEYNTETAKLYYYFTDDKLTHVLYSLGPLDYNRNNSKDYALKFKNYFEGYKEVFDNKYGVQTGRVNQNLGTANYMLYEAKWETYSTSIELIVSGDSHNLYLGTRFKDKKGI